MSLAARGSRQLAERVEKIKDAAELTQVRGQARRVRLKTLVAGLALTLLALLPPPLP